MNNRDFYILIGNYGVGNLGDELLKDFFVKEFAGVQWKVLSATPVNNNELPRLPGGLRSFLRFGWFKTLQALWRCKGVVFGGGTLFTDTESVFACFLWWWHGFVAWVFGKPIILAFQGVGPFRTRIGQWCAQFIFKRATHNSVRDEASFKRVESWNTTATVIQTADPVFAEIERVKNVYKKNSRIPGILVIIPRHNSNEQFISAINKELYKADYKSIHVLLLQPDNVNEQKICSKIKSSFSLPVTVFGVQDIESMVQVIQIASFVITQRFHGAVVAKALNVPFKVVTQAKGDKLSSLELNVNNVGLVLKEVERLRKML